jgi:hypothetical protein
MKLRSNMKSLLTIVLVALFTAFIATSCNEVTSEQKLKTLVPATLDFPDGATWTGVFMTNPAQIAVAAPTAENSPAFLAELTAIKALQAGLTPKQKEIIKYWSAGGILRWNEIMRGFVARFNLPPAPLPSGTYPAPDAENPFGDPNFPFANPPYAARAYSYLSAAQYDALRAAWHYKNLYNRQSPYNADPAIEALMTKTTLPGYPSEDAVMSGVSADVLKLLFPAAVEEITLLAAEQRSAALWSGKAAASDISAGLALGKAIAVLFTDRAKTDGLGTAGGNAVLWANLVTVAEGNGDVAWKSLETPPRPPMLPFFGLRNNKFTPPGGTGPGVTGVRMWMMPVAALDTDRPAPPPASRLDAISEEMLSEVEEVKYYAHNLTRERLAIVHKWADGAGTYTPPGHWDAIASKYIEDANYSEIRAARAFALLNMAIHDAGVACWDTKYFYFSPRPTQLDPSIKTGTGIPNFPAYTSGHSTFSAAAATVLTYLFPGDQSFFEEQANEASLSRLYGGIHYRKDCQEGLVHGRKVASYTVTFAQADGAD